MNNSDKDAIESTRCGCSTGPRPSWVSGLVDTAVGSVDVVRTSLDGADRRGMVWCRISDRFRMHYAVPPGLYAIGTPTDGSPIFVSANYKYSFDCLRSHLHGIDGWILVLDTKGINVWCAAGKKTFSTCELIRRIGETHLQQVTTQRLLILPQLGAPGVNAQTVKKETGFTIKYGPVDSAHIRAYLEAGYQATSAMRTASFSLADRVVLIPMELFPALRRFFRIHLIVFGLMGLGGQGILFINAWQYSAPLLWALFLALMLGIIAHVLLLPWTPFRAFSIKGSLLGILGVALWFWGNTNSFPSPYLLAAVFIGLPALSSYLALNFTGCTTFTNPSGVKKELRFAFPAYVTAAVLTAVALLLYKLEAIGFL